MIASRHVLLRPLALLLVAATLRCCLSTPEVKMEVHVRSDDVSGPSAASGVPIDSLDMKATDAFAEQFAANLREKYPPDMLLEKSLRVAGASTEAQLRNVFLKCVTPGANIHVGAIGGSITEHDDSWAGNFSALLSHLCPRAQVRMHNGARASHGALTLGLCARAVMAPELDIAMLEFSLNDQGQYTLPNGTFSSLPYELATRTVLTGTDPTPAVFGISFWGRSFTYDSAQPYHEEVHKLYGVTGISLRDMVWPYFSKGRAPFATKADVCSDVHHPNAFVHGLTAQIIMLYIVDLYSKWSAEVHANGFAPAPIMERQPLPAPIHPQLLAYDVDHFKFECDIVPVIAHPERGGKEPVLTHAVGWKTVYFPQCIQAVGGDSAIGRLHVSTYTGIVIMSNCYHPGLHLPPDKGPAFVLRLLEWNNSVSLNSKGVRGPDRGDVPPSRRSQLQLISVLDDNFEAFRIDPPLPPGNHTLEVVRHPDCARKAKGMCDGFYSLITL